MCSEPQPAAEISFPPMRGRRCKTAAIEATLMLLRIRFKRQDASLFTEEMINPCPWALPRAFGFIARNRGNSRVGIIVINEVGPQVAAAARPPYGKDGQAP